MRLHLENEPVVLLRGQHPLPVRPLVDDRATGPRGVVQKRLRPGAGRIMHIQRHRRRLHRRQTVMVVLRMERLDVADRIGAARHVEAMLAPTDGIIIGRRPAIRPRHHGHPVRTQHMQLRRQARHRRHRLQIAIARQQQLPEERLEQLGAPLTRVRAPDQVDHRMHLVAALVVLTDQRHGRCSLGDQLHAAKADRIARESRPRQTDRIPRAPDHAPRPRRHRHDPPRHGCLRFGRLSPGRGLRQLRLAEKTHRHSNLLVAAPPSGPAKERGPGKPRPFARVTVRPRGFHTPAPPWSIFTKKKQVACPWSKYGSVLKPPHLRSTPMRARLNDQLM